MKLPILHINGLDLEITKVYMAQTYASLIEGKPNAELHSELFVEFIDQARAIFKNKNPYVLYPNGDFGTDLPPVVVFLKLECFDVFKNLDADYSSLTVVLFQEEFDYPLPQNSIDALQLLPYIELCEEHYI